jgi:hypothetical protein
MPPTFVSAVTRMEKRCTKEITIPYNQNRNLKRHLVFIYNKLVVNRLQLHKWKNKKRVGFENSDGGGVGGPRQ